MALYSKFGVPTDFNSGRDVTIQPKLKFKFRVRFINFGGLESASYSFDATQQVISVQKPTITFSTADLGTYAGNVKVFNKPTYNPVNITFRDDMANTLGSAAWSQLQKQYDFNTGRYAVSAGSAKFTTIIETLDGVNEIRAVDSFILEGCFISNAEFGDLNYTEGSGVSEVNMAVDYDYLGGYLSEIEGGIEDPEYLMWYVTSNASSLATSDSLSTGTRQLFSSGTNI